jgi:hypothetical protein
MSVFLDESDLPPGEDYHSRIRNAVKAADRFVFLVSTHSVSSYRYTLSELEFAKFKWPHPQGRVFPVMISPVALEEIDPYLRAVTLLQPKGNVAAEVCSVLTERRHKTEQLMVRALTVLVLVVAAGLATRWALTRDTGIGFTTNPTHPNDYAEYLQKILAEKDVSSKVFLLEASDRALPPSDALRLNAQFAENTTMALPVKVQAIQCLKRLLPSSKEVIKKIASKQSLPDKQLAQAALGLIVKQVMVRISEIDDDGHLSVNGREIVTVDDAKSMGTESGWVDITRDLVSGSNTIKFRIHNGPYGGWSGRMQLSGGDLQYDSERLGRDSCPCNGDVLTISAVLTVGGDGTLRDLSVQPPVYL